MNKPTVTLKATDLQSPQKCKTQWAHARSHVDRNKCQCWLLLGTLGSHSCILAIQCHVAQFRSSIMQVLKIDTE